MICDAHPAVIERQEFKEVAALVCMDIDLLAEIATDNTLTADQLRDQIRLIHENKEAATSKPEQRRSRYVAAAMIFACGK